MRTRLSALLATFSAGSGAMAQCQPEWLAGPTVPGFDTTPGALTTWDPDGPGPLGPRLLVAGGFIGVGSVPAGPFAEWDGAAWADGFDWVSQPVSVISLTHYNGELIAGGITSPHAYLYSGPVVFRFDGASWVPLGQGPHGDPGDMTASVNAFAEFQGELVAAGRFDLVQGQPINNIARWNGSTWQPLGDGITVAGFNEGVNALAVFQGQLVAAGLFTGAGGQPVANIARWDGASWLPLGGIGGGGAAERVNALVVHNAGLFAAGQFTGAGGQAVQNIARWDGVAWSSVGAGVGGPVHALQAHAGALYAGGDFDLAGGQGANDIARWDGAAWAALGAGIGGPGDVDHVSRIHIFNDLVIAAGSFHAAGGAGAQHAAAWNPSTGQWSALAPGGGALEGEIRALLVDGGDLVAAGRFYTPQDQVINVMRRTGDTWAPMGTGVVLYHPAVGPHPGALLLTAYRDDPIIAGHFTHVSAVPASNIARWNGTAWVPLGGGLIGEYGYGVTAMTEFDGDLIAGGLFTHAGTLLVNRIARWDGDTQTWSSLAGGVTTHIPGGQHITALTVHEGALVATGSFSVIGGQTANRVARWNGVSWSPMGAGLSYAAWDVAVYNAELIAFLPTGEMSRWNGVSWLPLSMGVSAVPDALLVYRGELVLGRVNGFNGLARWNGTVLQPLGSGLGPWTNPDVNALVNYNGEMIAGGVFKTAGGGVSLGWARWGCHCYADCNNSASLTVADFGCFQSKYVLADPYADCNNSASLTIADFGCFQTKYVLGCP